MEFKAEELIGKGAVASVYLQDGYAYKKFKRSVPEEWTMYEFQTQQQIQQETDLRMPYYYEIIEKKIIRMDYIEGRTLAQLIRSKERAMKEGLMLLTELQQSVYHYTPSGLQNGHDFFEGQLKQGALPKKLKEKALQALETIPIGNQLCHFDFHFENIMYDGKHYQIIDWPNAKLSNPVLDIARSYVIFRQFVKRQANNYLKEMMKKEGLTKEALLPAISVMAAWRLMETGESPFSAELKEMI